jgi:beta-mannosidase
MPKKEFIEKYFSPNGPPYQKAIILTYCKIYDIMKKIQFKREQGMSKSYFNWTLSHSSTKDHLGTDVIPAKVPGTVQLDYAAAKNYAPYHYGLNFKQFDWMEDEYFFYDTELYFNAKENETALLCFEGIDYKYEISINSQTILQGEGIFTPQSIDVTKYSGKKSKLRVIVYPIPKRFAQPQNRSQASACCKPPSSYGWDWHPRLVPSGIIEPAYLDIIP